MALKNLEPAHLRQIRYCLFRGSHTKGWGERPREPKVVRDNGSHPGSRGRSPHRSHARPAFRCVLQDTGNPNEQIRNNFAEIQLLKQFVSKIPSDSIAIIIVFLAVSLS